MTVVGVLGLGALAQQVVGEGDIVRCGGIGAPGKTVQVVVGERDGLAAALAVAGDITRRVIAVLLVVGGGRGVGRGGVRVAQLHPAVMAVVLVGGAIALGIGQRKRKAVVAVGVGGSGLRQRTTDRTLGILHTAVGVVGGLGDPITALTRRQVLGDTDQTIQIIIGVVSDRDRGSGRRASGGRSGDRRAPGLEQFAGRGVRVTADQPLAADLCRAADEPSVGIVSGVRVKTTFQYLPFQTPESVPHYLPLKVCAK